jgi:hypothetical protein
MSFATKVLPIVILASALAACSDVAAPNQTFSAPTGALASKGGSGGGGGGGGSKTDTTVQLVVTTPPTVDATGTWVATDDGHDAVHTYTFTLTQTADGMVSGSILDTTPNTYAFELVVGTVNGNTLALYAGAGTVSPGAQLIAVYRGTISSDNSRIDGSFVGSSVSPRFFKQ